VANLEIIERYSHSLDIYTDENRYSPLGCDATVVFAYKDLRIRNNSNGIIQFEFEITNEKIRIFLKSEMPIDTAVLSFKIIEKQGKKEVSIYKQNGELINISTYK
jgi:vancomycin resistance protein VanW